MSDKPVKCDSYILNTPESDADSAGVLCAFNASICGLSVHGPPSLIKATSMEMSCFIPRSVKISSLP